MTAINSYNIHDVISVNSEVALPELEPFLSRELISQPTIEVRIGKPEQKNGRVGERHLFYTELLAKAGFEAEIRVDERIHVIASPLLRVSPHVLYTNLVEPILRWTFVQKGYALVHGATIAFGNKAYMITARTDTGKTTTLLKILDHQRRDTDNAAFISDDLTIVSPDGEVMTYPKPLTISAHTVAAINSTLLNRRQRFALIFQSRIHSRQGRRFAFQLNTLKMLPMATINAFVQFVVPPPKYHVTQLVPKVKLAKKAKLAGLFIIERGEEMDAPLDGKEALEILLTNCEDAFGFPPYNSIKEFLYLQDGQDLRPVEQGIIRQALEGVPANLIRSNSLEWWRRIPTFVGEDVAIFFAMHPERSNGSLRKQAVRV
ncbi:MAG TPA: hypothetical protein VF813_06505 [Anaerolineaceae bacterium]